MRHAVNPAGQLVLIPNLDAVGVAQLVQPDVGVDHLGRQPGLVEPAGGHRAAANHAGKIRVPRYLELPAATGPPQPPRHVKPVELDHRPRIGRPPGQRGLEVGDRPGKNPVPIGVQQPLRRQFPAEARPALRGRRPRPAENVSTGGKRDMGNRGQRTGVREQFSRRVHAATRRGRG